MEKIYLKFSSLKNHIGLKRYAANTSWMIGEKILRMLMGLIVGIWVARYLGPDQFGLLSYSQSLVFLFSIVSTLGLDSIVVREIVRDETQRDKLLGSAFVLKFIGAIAILPILGTTVLYTDKGYETSLIIFILAFSTIFQSFNVIDFYFQSKVLSKYVAIANSFSLGIVSLIKIGLIAFNAPLKAFALVISLEMLITAIGLIYFYSRKAKLSMISWRFDKTTAKQLLEESWPLIISGAINSIYMKIDQVMIGEMIDLNAVGIYSAATRLSEVWFGIGVVVARSVFPAIVNAKKISEDFYLKRINMLFFWMVIGAYSLVFSVIFITDFIISVLYGVEYHAAGPILSIHIASVIFVYLGVASGRWLLTEGLVKYDLYRNLVAVIINIILNIILIRLVGITGAAIASLISYIVAFYIFDLFLIRTRPIFKMKTKALFLMR